MGDVEWTDIRVKGPDPVLASTLATGAAAARAGRRSAGEKRIFVVVMAVLETRILQEVLNASVIVL